MRKQITIWENGLITTTFHLSLVIMHQEFFNWKTFVCLYCQHLNLW